MGFGIVAQCSVQLGDWEAIVGHDGGMQHDGRQLLELRYLLRKLVAFDPRLGKDVTDLDKVLGAIGNCFHSAFDLGNGARGLSSRELLEDASNDLPLLIVDFTQTPDQLA